MSDVPRRVCLGTIRKKSQLLLRPQSVSSARMKKNYRVLIVPRKEKYFALSLFGDRISKFVLM